MKTIETRWTKYCQSNTSSPYFDGDYYWDVRGGYTISYELNESKTAYKVTINHKVQSYQDVSGYYDWDTVRVVTKVGNTTIGDHSGKPALGLLKAEIKSLGTDIYNAPISNDGSCKFTINCSVTFSGYTRTFVMTYTLPKVNVASTITNNSSETNRIDFGGTINFSISRPNDSITHNLSYVIEETTYSIGSEITTSKSYVFPTSLVNKFPNNANVTITVNCNSSNGTSSSTTVYLHIPDSYKPTINLDVSDVGSVPSGWNIWLKTKSKIKGVITAAGSGGSIISSYSAKANEETFSKSTFTTSFVKNSGNVEITATVVDSRGRSASTNVIIDVVDYHVPSISTYEVYRCTSDGVENGDGTFARVRCNYLISPVNNLNTKQLKVVFGSQQKIYDLTDYSGAFESDSTDLFINLAENANHVFELYIIDSLNENIKFTYTVPPCFVLVSKLAGGKGICFGQVATQEGFHIEMDAYYRGIPIFVPRTTSIDESEV